MSTLIFWSIIASASPTYGEKKAPAEAPVVLPPVLELGPRDPQCQLTEKLPPDLAPKQGKVVVKVTQEIGRTVESFTLPDGLPVRFEQGGCVHFGMTLTFGLRTKPTGDLYATAIKHTARVRFADEDYSLSTMLKDAGSLSADGYFSCGDATCWVGVTEKAKGVQLVIDYDFPM